MPADTNRATCLREQESVACAPTPSVSDIQRKIEIAATDVQCEASRIKALTTAIIDALEEADPIRDDRQRNCLNRALGLLVLIDRCADFADNLAIGIERAADTIKAGAAA